MLHRKIICKLQLLFFITISTLISITNIALLISSSTMFFQHYKIDTLSYVLLSELTLIIILSKISNKLEKLYHPSNLLNIILSLYCLTIMIIYYFLENSITKHIKIWSFIFFTFSHASFFIITKTFFKIATNSLKRKKKLHSLTLASSIGGLIAGLGVYNLHASNHKITNILILSTILLTSIVIIKTITLYFAPSFIKKNQYSISNHNKKSNKNKRSKKIKLTLNQIIYILKTKKLKLLIISSILSKTINHNLYYLTYKQISNIITPSNIILLLSSLYIITYIIILTTSLILKIFHNKLKISKIISIHTLSNIIPTIILLNLEGIITIIISKYIWKLNQNSSLYKQNINQIFNQAIEKSEREKISNIITITSTILATLLTINLITTKNHIYQNLTYTYITIYLITNLYLKKEWIKSLKQSITNYINPLNKTIFKKLIYKQLNKDFNYLSNIIKKENQELILYYLKKSKKIKDVNTHNLLRQKFNTFNQKIQISCIKHISYKAKKKDIKFIKEIFKKSPYKLKLEILTYHPHLKSLTNQKEIQEILTKTPFQKKYKQKSLIYLFQNSNKKLKIKLINFLKSKLLSINSQEKILSMSTAKNIGQIQLILNPTLSIKSENEVKTWINIIKLYPKKIKHQTLTQILNIFKTSNPIIKNQCIKIFEKVNCETIIPQLISQFHNEKEKEKLSILTIYQSYPKNIDITKLLKLENITPKVFFKLITIWKNLKDIPSQFREEQNLNELLNSKLNQYLKIHITLKEINHPEPLLIKVINKLIQKHLNKLIIWNLSKINSQKQNKEIEKLCQILSKTKQQKNLNQIISNKKLKTNSSIKSHLKLKNNPKLWEKYYIKNTSTNSKTEMFKEILSSNLSPIIKAISIYSSQFLNKNQKENLKEIYKNINNQKFNHKIVKQAIKLFNNKLENKMLNIFDKIKVFYKISLFSSLSIKSLESIAQESQELQFSPGEIISEKGELDNKIYILEKGTVTINKSIKKAPNYFGELNIFGDKKHKATIKSKDNINLITIKGEFLRKLENQTEILLPIINKIIDNLNNIK